MRVILASTNQHKLEEIKLLLKDFNLNLLCLKDFPSIPEPPETKATFHGNAEQKALFVYEYTKGVVIADDSGIEVHALQGAPGVHSKRYSPEETAEANNQKLLKAMDQKEDRQARFRCVLAIHDGQKTRYIEGMCNGSIAKEKKGSKGFGYDPIFLPEGYDGKTMAELSTIEKNEISHRGKAFRQLPELLRKEFTSNQNK